MKPKTNKAKARREAKYILAHKGEFKPPEPKLEPPPKPPVEIPDDEIPF